MKKKIENTNVTKKIFRELQKKFTMIVSTVCIILALVAFSAVYIVNAMTLHFDIDDSLNSAMLLFSNTEQGIPLFEIDDPAQTNKVRKETDCMIILQSNGNIMLDLRFLNVDDEEVEFMCRSLIDGNRNMVVNGRNYSAKAGVVAVVQNRRIIDCSIYVFCDYTMSQTSLNILLLVLILVFVFIAIVIVVLVYLFSGRFLQPALVSFIKQKELVANASHELKTDRKSVV